MANIAYNQTMYPPHELIREKMETLHIPGVSACCIAFDRDYNLYSYMVVGDPTESLGDSVWGHNGGGQLGYANNNVNLF